MRNMNIGTNVQLSAVITRSNLSRVSSGVSDVKIWEKIDRSHNGTVLYFWMYKC